MRKFGRLVADKSILIFSYYFPPSPASGVFRCVRLVKGLSQRGWRPLVVAAAPEYQGLKPDETLLAQLPPDIVVRYTSVSFPDEVISNALRRNPTKKTDPSSEESPSAGRPAPVVPKQRTGIARVAQNIWDYALTTPDRAIWWRKPALAAARELVARHRPAVVLSTTPPHSTQLIASRFCRSSGLPWIMDMRDPWARGNWPRERNPWGHRMVPRLEKRCVAQADRVVLNTFAALQDFREHYRDQPAEKFVCIPNGYDPELLARTEQLLRDAVPSRNGRFRLCHPGAMVDRRDPRPLIAAIGQLAAAGHDVEIELVGFIAPEFALERVIAEQQLSERVKLTGPVSHREAMERMANADGFVVVQPDTAMQVPGKLYEMLMFRKPIIGLTGSGATADLIKQYGLGTISEPSRIDDIANAIQHVMDRPALKNPQWDRALEDYNGDRLSMELVAVVEGLVHNGPSKDEP